MRLWNKKKCIESVTESLYRSVMMKGACRNHMKGWHRKIVCVRARVHMCMCV